MHLISPSKVIKGRQAWLEAIPHILKITKSPLILGRSQSTQNIRNQLARDLTEKDVNVISANLEFDCCFEDLNRIRKLIVNNKCDAIIASGGGKVLDAGKYLSDFLSIPCITVPLSASTCAGWTALSNIYSTKGQFISDINLKSCPDILVYDHDFIEQAPINTLTSGIADALAKWYESSITSSSNKNGIIQQAIQISRVLRDQLFIEGKDAYKNPTVYNSSWCNIVEGTGLTAGLIGGFGGEKCRTAAAHAIHNAITQLMPKNKPLHGEIVGVGILLQLKLEQLKNNNQLANQSIKQLVRFMKDLNLPCSIAELGIDVFENDNLNKIAHFTCREDSEIHFLPFKIIPSDIVEIIASFESKKIAL